MTQAQREAYYKKFPIIDTSNMPLARIPPDEAADWKWLGVVATAVVGTAALAVVVLYLGVCFLFIGPLIGLSAFCSAATAVKPR